MPHNHDNTFTPEQYYNVAKQHWHAGISPLMGHDEYYAPLQLLLDSYISKIREYDHDEFTREFFESADLNYGYCKNFSDLKEELRKNKQKINNAKTSFYVAFPIMYWTIDGSHISDHFKACGVEFKKLSNTDYNIRYGKESHAYMSSFRHHDGRRYDMDNATGWHYFEAKVRALNAPHAIEKVSYAINLVANCINVINGNRLEKEYLERPFCLNALSVVGFFIAHDNKDDRFTKTRHSLSSLRRYPESQIPLSIHEGDINKINNLLNIFEKTDQINKRRQMIIASMADAYKTEDLEKRQLSFWRCVEIATAKDYKTTRERNAIKHILMNSKKDAYDNETELLKITAASAARDNFVHTGNPTPVGDFGFKFKPILWAKGYALQSLDLLDSAESKGSDTKSKIKKFFDELAGI